MFRTIVLGGQQAPAERPANTVATYGMTESGSGVVYDGVALEGVELKAVSGEIVFGCPMLLRCYRSEPIPKHRPVGSGRGRWPDRPRRGSHNPRSTGRCRHLRRGGIWPAQVEKVLLTHRLVTEAAVGGAPDAHWGTRLVAYIVVAAEGDETEPASLLEGASRARRRRARRLRRPARVGRRAPTAAHADRQGKPQRAPAPRGAPRSVG